MIARTSTICGFSASLLEKKGVTLENNNNQQDYSAETIDTRGILLMTHSPTLDDGFSIKRRSRSPTSQHKQVTTEAATKNER
jgi:hypothetical protein